MSGRAYRSSRTRSGLSLCDQASARHGNLLVFVGAAAGQGRYVHLRLADVWESAEYVALGDSFSSGEGESDEAYYRPGTEAGREQCHLSIRSYPFLVGRLLALPEQDVVSAACAGARIRDIVGGDSYRGQGGRLEGRADPEAMMDLAVLDKLPGRAPQRSFVAHYQPDIVTIGIGGNDAGLIDKLKACAMPGRCEWSYPSRQSQVAAEINRLYQPLVATYGQILADAPATRLFVVGYPGIMSDAQRCDGLTGVLFDAAERAFVVHGIQLLNQVIKKAADAAGATYVEVGEAFQGRKLCDTRPMAMNGLRTGDDVAPVAIFPGFRLIGSETFHPTPFGHTLIAPHVADAIRSETSDLCPSDCGEPLTSEGDTLPVLIYEEMLEEISIDLRRPILHVRVPAGIVKPFASVRVEVHSKPTLLGTIEADADGSVTGDLMMPNTFEQGYHTIHLHASDRFERPVELYQAFELFAGNGGRAMESTSIALSSQGIASPDDGPVLREVKATEHDSWASLSRQESKGNFLYWVIAAGVITLFVAVLLGRRLISMHRPDG